MIADFVLDTSALIAYVRGEPGAPFIASILSAHYCIMHAVNVGEFCYTAVRCLPDRFVSPESAILWLNQAGVGRSHDLTSSFLILSARVRRASPALSFGDGVAVALASALCIPLLTTEKAFDKAAEFAEIRRIR